MATATVIVDGQEVQLQTVEVTPGQQAQAYPVQVSDGQVLVTVPGPLGTSIFVGPSPPDDTTSLWLDTQAIQ